jgi:uncharacterized protein YprB with RNaseH-like and TPR domain
LSSLADRVRGIVKAGVPAVTHVPTASRDDEPESTRLAEDVWGGAVRDGCYVVERRWEPTVVHGHDTIGAVADRIQRAAGEAPFFARGAPARPPFVFFDLETTGLNGGAGTHAFLVGCGWFEDAQFVTRQFVMRRHADERAMLETVARECASAGALVSFNGKSFDAPMLETRYLFHRLSWFGVEKPHVDLLHPARQFWRRDDCSLQALERQLVGHKRRGDVAGFEVPGRYFQFVRSGDPAPLCQVLEHNRLDLLSLAALTARLLDLARQGPAAARDAREALALGHVFTRAGLESRGRDGYERAVELSRAPRGAFDAVKIEAMRALALAWRRAREFDRAAGAGRNCWAFADVLRGLPRKPAKPCDSPRASAARDFREAHRFARRRCRPG